MSLSIISAAERAALPPLSRAAFKMADVVLRWDVRRRLRKDLSRLDAHLLDDIGVLPHLADAESRKPFWRE